MTRNLVIAALIGLLVWSGISLASAGKTHVAQGNDRIAKSIAHAMGEEGGVQ